VTDLGTMVADVMHPDLVSLQPFYGVEDFMETDDVVPIQIGRTFRRSKPFLKIEFRLFTIVFFRMMHAFLGP